jgi:hypothetical protein
VAPWRAICRRGVRRARVCSSGVHSQIQCVASHAPRTSRCELRRQLPLRHRACDAAAGGPLSGETRHPSMIAPWTSGPQPRTTSSVSFWTWSVISAARRHIFTTDTTHSCKDACCATRLFGLTSLVPVAPCSSLQERLSASGVLARCPHARCCGINQVAAQYDQTDVTGLCERPRSCGEPYRRPTAALCRSRHAAALHAPTRRAPCAARGAAWALHTHWMRESLHPPPRGATHGRTMQPLNETLE